MTSGDSRGRGARLEGRVRRLAFALLRASGVPMLLRHTAQRNRVTILLFHQQDVATFERTARALMRRYSVISLSRALEALDSGSFSALPRRPLVLTFDDGRASNAQLIPAFERYGIRPTVFVATGVTGTNRHFWWTHLSATELATAQALPEAERPAYLASIGQDPTSEHEHPQALTSDELAALAGVADIQPHTRTHPVLTRCSAEEIRREVEGSMADVARLTGGDPRVFAYPNGALSEDVVAVVAECGITHAVTTEPVLVGANSDPLRLGRIFVRDTASVSELIVFASGLQARLKRLL